MKWKDLSPLSRKSQTRGRSDFSSKVNIHNLLLMSPSCVIMFVRSLKDYNLKDLNTFQRQVSSLLDLQKFCARPKLFTHYSFFSFKVSPQRHKWNVKYLISHSAWSPWCHFHSGCRDELRSSSLNFSAFRFVFFFMLPPELIDYSAPTVYDNLIIRARKHNEILMEYVMFWAKTLPPPQIIT